LKPVDVYNLWGSKIISDEQNIQIKTPVIHKSMSDKCDAQFVYKHDDPVPKGLKKSEISKALLIKLFTANDILKLSHASRINISNDSPLF